MEIATPISTVWVVCSEYMAESKGGRGAGGGQAERYATVRAVRVVVEAKCKLTSG
jgi:hypothetical protein